METLANVNKTTTSTEINLSEKINTIYGKQKQFFATGTTRTYAFRVEQLLKLRSAIQANEQKITEALYKDFKKPAYEVYTTEIGPVLSEIRLVLKELKKWMKPKNVATPLPFLPSSSKIYRDALGITLIISPWNYPFMLLIQPLISAIAGGNTIIVKPSEVSANTASAMVEILKQNFDESYIAAIEGDGYLVGKELVENHHFDHIFFTGSVNVGKKIMEMAAKHLSPVTLELGGKSPCIVDKDASIDFAARKIAWSKWINVGQTCVAPDYVLVHESIKDQFLQKLGENITKMYGDNPELSADYGRVISDSRFNALEKYLHQGKIEIGGQRDASTRYIAPTVITDVKKDDLIMQDEIFGPILPVIAYSNEREVLDWIDLHPNPLALYVFTENKRVSDFFIENVRFGGGCVNNGLVHLANSNLPFGGVGNSGVGQYHGIYGFETFTRQKPILKTPSWIDVPIIYAPYKNNVKWIKKIMR
jgi:aldehyde dehydrogenase (NAD+)